MQVNITMKNNKKLQTKVLVDSGCTYTGIDKQLVKNKRIQTRPINFFFGVYNANRTKNGDVTKVALLEIKINRHKEYIEAVVTNLNSTDIFLGHNWLVKHNLKMNWKKGKIQFIRCPGSYRMKY